MFNRSVVLLALASTLALAQPDNSIDDVRGLRAGASFFGGVRTPFPAAEFGGELRGGVQVTQIFSLYGTIAGQVGLGPVPPGSLSGVSGAFTASLLAEVFLFELGFLAIGPGFGWGQLVVPDAILLGDQHGSISSTGAKAIANVRGGVTIPIRGWPPHSGVSIALNGQLMFHPDAELRFARTEGVAEQPPQYRMAMTFTPTLMVGVDWR
ncbi:MAG: hypothetical protein DI536_32225 [Archangium gephyra]|uniref:Outer membrane protein beta-barrel domain-containing protein n=1 Tax=Archangium gephyra TaxID=48 RepID=A0A2W5V697_9BACT|nr:MAG: hypothetical protein DI536_32225 [Archangium gephyra]